MNAAIKAGDDVVVAKSGLVVHVLHIETLEDDPQTIVVHTDWGPYEYCELKELVPQLPQPLSPNFTE